MLLIQNEYFFLIQVMLGSKGFEIVVC